MRPNHAVTVFIAVSLLVWSGCGSSGRPHAAATVPVKGTVTYKGKPLSGGEITFEPGFGREAFGTIQSDGTFVLTTFKEGDGAVVGTHRVAVTGTAAGGRQATPLKYKNTSSSKIQVEVSEGKTDYSIDLQ